jgi:hypothetical protein
MHECHIFSTVEKAGQGSCCFESIETGKVYIFHAEKIQYDLSENKAVGLVLDWYDVMVGEK